MSGRDRTAGAKRDATDALADRQGDAGVRLGMLEDLIGFHLRLAQNVSFRAFKRLTGEAQLRPGWFAVLTLIERNPGITPMALSRASGRDKSTITPILRDLLRESLVRREDIPTDRRSYSLFLTAKGRGKLAHLSACAAQHDRDLDAIVGDRKGELLSLLRAIAAMLD
jgi:DNA-binding MarR family transcriptional regulator